VIAKTILAALVQHHVTDRRVVSWALAIRRLERKDSSSPGTYDTRDVTGGLDCCISKSSWCHIAPSATVA